MDKMNLEHLSVLLSKKTTKDLWGWVQKTLGTKQSNYYWSEMGQFRHKNNTPEFSWNELRIWVHININKWGGEKRLSLNSRLTRNNVEEEKNGVWKSPFYNHHSNTVITDSAKNHQRMVKQWRKVWWVKGYLCSPKVSLHKLCIDYKEQSRTWQWINVAKFTAVTKARQPPLPALLLPWETQQQFCGPPTVI